MKKFGIVLQFEIMNYIKNKTYMVSTFLLAFLIGFILFLPNIVDMSSFLGISSKEENIEGDITGEEITQFRQMVLYDQGKILSDRSILEQTFHDIKWTFVETEEEVKEQVSTNKAEAGFVTKSYSEYDYYVYNKTLSDYDRVAFDSVINTLSRQNYCTEHQLNYEELSAIYDAPVQVNEEVLGKDMESNYWYSYALVIVIFMIIIMYGVMIATSVTSEKSNRSIEVLVTSADTTSLLFGKVIAGGIASFVQVSIVLGVSMVCYRVNQAAWGNMLDLLLDIPGSVILVFALFGIGGFFFYAFIYGAIGALVSKTEDINKSAGSIQMVIMIVYFAVLLQMQNIDGIIMKVASFLPFSSYSAMFTRVAMGNVATWEIVVSFIILVISTIGMGILGAKVYRMGTLRYGNPIKLKHALKSIRKQ